MVCIGRYVEVWQFVVFFCMSLLIQGMDNLGGVGNVVLIDLIVVSFIELGVEVDVGMMLYNVI